MPSCTPAPFGPRPLNTGMPPITIILLQLNKAFYEDRGMQALGFAGLTVTEFDLGAEYTPPEARRRRRRKRAATGDTGTEATAFVQLMTPVTGS